MADSNVSRVAAATIATERDWRTRGCRRCGRKPWEDIFTGYALSRMFQHGVHIGVVDVTWRLFAENWGERIAGATLLWHSKRKKPEHLRLVHSWAQTHHCSVPADAHAECPPTLYRLPCGWRIPRGMTRQRWLRANRTVRMPWQICRAPGAGRERFCDETVHPVLTGGRL